MAGTYYSNCSTLSTSGCFLYTDSNLTPASDGYYSNGTNCFTVSGGSGQITQVGSCTFTVDVYAAVDQTGLDFVKIQYSTNNGASWSDVGTLFDNASCGFRGTFSVSGGSSFKIRAVNSGISTYYHNSTYGPSCPGGPYSLCESTFSDIVTNIDIAITVDTNSGC